MPSPLQTRHELRRVQTILLLRWVLIIATAYLMLFSRPLLATPPSVALFVAAYFASNLVVTWLLPRLGRRSRMVDVGLVLFDTGAICLGLALTANVSNDFFLLYFLVLFLGALTERLGLVVAAAVVASVVHLVTVSSFVDLGHLMREGYLMRIPFLFVVALFFGHLVEDEAQSRERLRVEFVSTVSHDLKNPLAVIQSIAELLLDGNAGALNADQAQFVRRIYASARHVIALSHNLLSAARIEAGHLTLLRSPESLVNVVETAITFARGASDLKGVALSLVCERDIPRVHLDTVQMERAISNILDNAIRYTPPGGQVVAAIQHSGRQLVLTIHDDGPGIASEDLPAVFEKYHRRARRSREGTGFGLFIVKAIVEGHGGQVAADSTPGHGTTITIRLPTVEVQSKESSASNGSSKRPWPQRLLCPSEANAQEPAPLAVSSRR
jgi:signal transduction histidine kinase